MRLLTAAVITALLLLAACDDDNPSSTATPEASPTEGAVAPGQLTPNANACKRDVLEGVLVSQVQTGRTTVITVEANNIDAECVFDGPPELRFYRADGTAAGVPFTPAEACESDATEYDNCVYQEQIALPDSDFNLPIGTIYKVRAIASINDLAELGPCATPITPIEARKIGLQFPGVPLDVQVDLDTPVQVQTCVAQVYLLGYGPVKTGED